MADQVVELSDMAQRIIVYWRDIPAQIIVRAGRKNAKRELPEKFVQAIDRCAMRTGAIDSDAYLAEWRRGEPEPCGDNLEVEAEAALEKIQYDYSNEALKVLIANDGWANAASAASSSSDQSP